MSKINKIIIATRGSKLALWQAKFIGNSLKNRYPSLDIEYNIIKTSGDKILDVPLAKIGGKGLFVKEIEQALIRGDAHIAVHSMKDVPAILPHGLEVNIIPKRECPFDAFLSEKYKSLDQLPEGAVVGTSSLRRQAQIKKMYSHLEIKMLRGNLDTRIRKLKEGQYDAIIVAMAGLRRLGMSATYVEELCPPKFLPAVGQGALGIEYASDETELIEKLSFLDDFQTNICLQAERAFLYELEGGCQVPIGAYASLRGNKLHFIGFVSHPSGEPFIYSETQGDVANPREVGRLVAKNILKNGGADILKEIY